MKIINYIPKDIKIFAGREQIQGLNEDTRIVFKEGGDIEISNISFHNEKSTNNKTFTSFEIEYQGNILVLLEGKFHCLLELDTPWELSQPPTYTMYLERKQEKQ